MKKIALYPNAAKLHAAAAARQRDRDRIAKRRVRPSHTKGNPPA